MTLSKKLITLSAIGVISVTILSYLEAARADTNGSALATKIAQKFNLNEGDVKQVIEEHHQEKRTEREEEIKTKLDLLVSDGKITSEQKEALLNKFEEIKSNKEENKGEFKNMTHEERHKEMEEKKNEMDEWLSQNGIDKSILQEVMGMPGRGRGMHLNN